MDWELFKYMVKIDKMQWRSFRFFSMNSIRWPLNLAWTYLYNPLWWLSLLRIQILNSSYKLLDWISMESPKSIPRVVLHRPVWWKLCFETSILFNVETFFFILLLRHILLDLFCFYITLSILACESQLHTIFRVVVVRNVEKLPTWPNIVQTKGNKIWYPPEIMVSRPKIYLTYLCNVRIIFYTFSRFGAWTSTCNVLVIDLYVQPTHVRLLVKAVVADCQHVDLWEVAAAAAAAPMAANKLPSVLQSQQTSVLQ